MTTIDTRDLEAVCGGTLDWKASQPAWPSAWPGALQAPQLPKQPPSTMPLGPFYPPSTNPNIA